LNVKRDAAGVREFLGMKAEDRDIARGEFAHDSIGVLVVVVGNDQNGRHRLYLGDSNRGGEQESGTQLSTSFRSYDG
jgi:hypothetical protein